MKQLFFIAVILTGLIAILSHWKRQPVRNTLMKLALFASLLLAAGCFEGAGNDLAPTQTHKIIIIEKCQYILISRRPWSGEMAMAHKGNCTNNNHAVNPDRGTP